MSAKEGISRIAKAISVVSWVALGGGLLTTVSLSMMARRDVGIVFFGGLLASFVAWGLCQGLVWIIDGFAGNKDETSSLLWPVKRKKPLARVSFNEEVKVSPQLAGSRPDLRGIGGWLVFFIITLTVINPLTVLGGTASNIREAERLYPNLISFVPWQNYKMVSWVVVLVAVGSFLWCGWILWKQHISSSVRAAITCIWVVPIMLIVCDIVAADYFLQVGPSEMLNKETLFSLIRGFSYATVWTLYLKLSRRVKNTYTA